ncbi:hypothetical protein [Phaeobacter sp. NW0010-22]|uniref:hypothetical protein n=1 Tax=Phaeobacter sp. NW0010-22 TaxID=3135907 RepID=UPI0031056CF5
MATKAELEAELLDLRRQMADRPSQQLEALEEDHTEGASDTSSSEATNDRVDWDKEVSDIMADLEDLPHKQPLLFALGAFAVGYLVGRSR